MKAYTRSGAVIPSHSGKGDEQHARGKSPGLVLGYIKKVVFPESNENITGQLEYVVNIGGQDFYGCLDATAQGGIFNNHIRVRKGQNPDINPKSMNPIGTDDEKNGDAVWCLQIRDNFEHPIIVGAATHPRTHENSDYKKPSASLGQFERYEFNGLEFMVNKDGDLTVTQLGKKDAILGKAVPPLTSVLKLDKTGAFLIKTSIGDQIRISATEGVQIEVPTGAKASFKNANVTLEEPLGGKLKLFGSQVGLGGPAGEVVDLMEQTLTQLDTLITQILAITVPTAVGPSGTPINAAAIAPVQVALGLIKGMVTAIKGGI